MRRRHQANTVGIFDKEEGSATVSIVGMIAALLVITLFIVSGATLYAHRSHLQGVADMAALAGADATPMSLIFMGGASQVGCNVSSSVVELNGVTLDSCVSDESGDVRIEVSEPMEVLGFSVTIRARARAGPAATIAVFDGSWRNSKEGGK